MSFYEQRLLPIIEKTCAAIEQTPHMQDILHGTMPLERFRYQIKQNYQYLKEYTRCWAVGLSKARSFEQMLRWYKIVANTFEKTVISNRTYWADQIGLSADELESAVMAPGKRSYTSHQLARAMEGDLAGTMMALFPCNVLYWHMGMHLLPQCTLPEGNMYRYWIEFYTLPEYVAKCREEIDEVERLCAGKDEAELARLLEIFAVSCNYEILQWRDMYYNMEQWPLPDIFPAPPRQ